MNWTELVVSVLTPIAGALLLYLAAQVQRAILEHVKQTRLRTILLRLNDAIFDAVGEIQQTSVSLLKAGAKDGKLSPTEMNRVRDAAVEKAKEYLGEKGVSQVREVLGVGDEALEKLLVAKIERTVAELHAGKVSGLP